MDINYEELLKLIMDTMEAASLVDENANLIYMSRNYANILGYGSPEEIVGRPLKEVVPNSRIPAILASRRKSLGEYYLLENGQPVFANRFPLISEEGVKGLFASAVIYDLDDVAELNAMVNLLRQENSMLKRELAVSKQGEYSFDNIIGQSEKVSEIKDLIEKFAGTNLNVLITGETGVGKEIYANAIHYLSGRHDKPFVKINCAAIPKDLLESELFGYEEGSFSGAVKRGKIGKFEYANGGTILLDEIGEMPLMLQSKLLRVIQEKEIERIGALKPVPLDVRVICCTNRDLGELIRQGQFRQDLYYRINTVEIEIPPLRERVEDIFPFCEFFIKKINRDQGIFITGISENVIGLFQEYHWEGNVRELEHVLERACVAVGAGELQLRDFSFFLSRLFQRERASLSPGQEVLSLAEKKAYAEKEEIIKALIKTNGNKTEAAKILQIDRTLLYGKIKKYEIKL